MIVLMTSAKGLIVEHVVLNSKLVFLWCTRLSYAHYVITVDRKSSFRKFIAAIRSLSGMISSISM